MNFSKLISLVLFYIAVSVIFAKASADSPPTARVAKALAELKNLHSALQMYNLENKVYPSTNQGLSALISKPVSEPKASNWQHGGYLAKLPLDPWGREYMYINPGNDAPVEVYTYGRDGLPGGCEKNRDLFSSGRFEGALKCRETVTFEVAKWLIIFGIASFLSYRIYLSWKRQLEKA